MLLNAHSIKYDQQLIYSLISIVYSNYHLWCFITFMHWYASHLLPLSSDHQIVQTNNKIVSS